MMNFLRTLETASLLETKPSHLSYSDGFIPSLPLFSATAGRSGRLTAAGILVAVVGAKAPYYDSRDDNDPPKVVVIVSASVIEEHLYHLITAYACVVKVLRLFTVGYIRIDI